MSAEPGLVCDGGVGCQDEGPPPECVDHVPCVESNFCRVQGRDYFEEGCA
jgi:hypothetical protein